MFCPNPIWDAACCLWKQSVWVAKVELSKVKTDTIKISRTMFAKKVVFDSFVHAVSSNSEGGSGVPVLCARNKACSVNPVNNLDWFSSLKFVIIEQLFGQFSRRKLIQKTHQRRTFPNSAVDWVMKTDTSLIYTPARIISLASESVFCIGKQTTNSPDWKSFSFPQGRQNWQNHVNRCFGSFMNSK